ncbi:MAG: amidohydrolase family protein [bacterium]
MDFELIIKGGSLYTGFEKFEADIGIKDGKITEIGSNITEDAGRIIDASGCQVLPAAIDPHVHFNLELPLLGITSRDDYNRGTKAAAHGGVTTVIDYGNQQEGGSLLAGIQQRIDDEIEGLTAIDYSLHGCVYHWHAGVLEEMEELVARGFPTLKMFMIYSGEGWQSDEPALLEALRRAGQLGATVCVHCENDLLLNHFTEQTAAAGSQAAGAYALALSRPNIVEYSAIQTVVQLCEFVDGRLYVVHTSTGEGVDIIAAARRRGVQVFGETAPQFLTLTEEVLKREDGHLFASSPQVKTERDSERLWQGLKEDTMQVIGTDNCTFNREQKDCWDGDFRKIPRGMPGCETMFPIIYTHGYLQRGWSLNRVVRATSYNAARIHGLYPDKGTLAVDTDADIIIVDPEKAKHVVPGELITDCDWSPYDGMKLYGFPRYTICRGRLLVDEGEVCSGIEGHGRLVRRKAAGDIEL